MTMRSLGAQEELRKFSKTFLKVASNLVEIGSYAGESAQVFSEFVQVVYCVDPWMALIDSSDPCVQIETIVPAEKEFDRRMSLNPKLKKLKMKGVDAAPLFADGTIDAVYIDGLHSAKFVAEDIKTWLPKIKIGGWIGGHDYSNKGVFLTVEEILGKPELLEGIDNWGIRKVNS